MQQPIFKIMETTDIRDWILWAKDEERAYRDAIYEAREELEKRIP